MTKARVLVVDDEETSLGVIKHTLEYGEYEVVATRDGLKALDIARDEQFDLVLLDIMMPKIDGWEVCRRLRQVSAVPIMFITALTSEMDIIRGFKVGADDYVLKPFSPQVLLARIKAMLRREHRESQNRLLHVDNILIDQDRYEVYQGTRLVDLSKMEYELLKLLMANASNVVTREEIFKVVWGTDYVGDTRTLNVHVSKLRQKLGDSSDEPRYIETVRGIGYRFIKQQDDKLFDID